MSRGHPNMSLSRSLGPSSQGNMLALGSQQQVMQMNSQQTQLQLKPFSQIHNFSQSQSTLASNGPLGFGPSSKPFGQSKQLGGALGTLGLNYRPASAPPGASLSQTPSSQLDGSEQQMLLSMPPPATAPAALVKHPRGIGMSTGAGLSRPPSASYVDSFARSPKYASQKEIGSFAKILAQDVEERRALAMTEDVQGRLSALERGHKENKALMATLGSQATDNATRIEQLTDMCTKISSTVDSMFDLLKEKLEPLALALAGKAVMHEQGSQADIIPAMMPEARAWRAGAGQCHHAEQQHNLYYDDRMNQDAPAQHGHQHPSHIHGFQQQQQQQQPQHQQRYPGPGGPNHSPVSGMDPEDANGHTWSPAQEGGRHRRSYLVKRTVVDQYNEQPSGCLKRRRVEQMETQCYMEEEAVLEPEHHHHHHYGTQGTGQQTSRAQPNRTPGRYDWSMLDQPACLLGGGSTRPYPGSSVPEQHANKQQRIIIEEVSDDNQCAGQGMGSQAPWMASSDGPALPMPAVGSKSAKPTKPNKIASSKQQYCKQGSQLNHGGSRSSGSADALAAPGAGWVQKKRSPQPSPNAPLQATAAPQIPIGTIGTAAVNTENLPPDGARSKHAGASSPAVSTAKPPGQGKSNAPATKVATTTSPAGPAPAPRAAKRSGGIFSRLSNQHIGSQQERGLPPGKPQIPKGLPAAAGYGRVGTASAPTPRQPHGKQPTPAVHQQAPHQPKGQQKVFQRNPSSGFKNQGQAYAAVVAKTCGTDVNAPDGDAFSFFESTGAAEDAYHSAGAVQSQPDGRGSSIMMVNDDELAQQVQERMNKHRSKRMKKMAAL